METSSKSTFWGTSLSHCLEHKRLPQEVAKVQVASTSETSALVNMVVLNDLIGEPEKDKLIGGLVCSIFRDVVEKAVSLHEWERGPFGAAHGGLMIPSSWLLEKQARSYYGGGRSA
mmetsp:Transcript_37598/g.58469  ORF Transcript_37598/g.58469 Transcript_37598/m.58469 type:complete len:116 (+) Transcript_37598:596-943(+)|eukprot:CAMPEP_0194572984 /NCGR_PEP_ID=MMETSP0292-20121207/9349_1 /TAXON_ID=39354 /ORGANISM="Heterosigma akashiwo, Strain CCMP2393" /LENGTH=115 /DNA_ID=CAMNT_0039424079 /DNA_START=606 /DNA_END=953 /DNA_ORIENTATION=+